MHEKTKAYFHLWDKKIKNTKKKMVEVGSFKYCDNKETLHIHLNRVQISVFVSTNTQPKYGRSKQNKKSTWYTYISGKTTCVQQNLLNILVKIKIIL